MKRRLVALLAVLAFLVVACGNSGAPTSYVDNPAEYKGEPNVGQAERNYRDGCEESGQDNLDARVQANIVEVCECAFEGIRMTLSFEEFIEIDDDYRSDINADVNAAVDRIVRQCILDEAGF